MHIVLKKKYGLIIKSEGQAKLNTYQWLLIDKVVIASSTKDR